MVDAGGANVTYQQRGPGKFSTPLVTIMSSDLNDSTRSKLGPTMK